MQPSTPSRARARRLVVAVTLAAAFASGAAACDQAKDVLDAGDRSDFADAANAFIEASNDLQVSASTVATDPQAFVTEANEDVATMEDQIDKMTDIAGKVDGDAKRIADDAVAAAGQVLQSSKDVIAAVEAGDDAALQAAASANETAIDDFNAAADAWNSQ